MISFIFGENTFENERKLQEVTALFSGDPERFDGEGLEAKHLPDLFMATTFFAKKRLIIIKNLSANKVLWNMLDDWLDRLSSDIHLVLVETKPDKRSKIYKQLQKTATIYESRLWGDRDNAKAEQWVISEAGQLGFTLDKKSAHIIVARVGADQWLLHQALQKLALVDELTIDTIYEVIDANPTENIFNLFEAALRGEGRVVCRMLQTLAITEDPYKIFGLLSTQAFQLAAVIVSDKPTATIAADLGAHSFTLSKLTPFAKSFDQTDVRKIITTLDEADIVMKTSAIEPWLLLERSLLKIASNKA